MLIIIAAHIPISRLQRHEGRIFSPMAYTVTSALVWIVVVFTDAGAVALLFPAAEKYLS